MVDVRVTLTWRWRAEAWVSLVLYRCVSLVSRRLAGRLAMWWARRVLKHGKGTVELA